MLRIDFKIMERGILAMETITLDNFGMIALRERGCFSIRNKVRESGSMESFRTISL